MAYCTQADITKQITENQLIQLTDDADAGVVDTAVVDDAIAAADDVIDGYCAQRYTVPFSPTPGIINKISVDLAIYNLYSRRAHAIPELRKERYEQALKMLREIEAGKISLGVPAPTENPDRVGDFDANDRLFTRDNMTGF